MGSLTLPAKLVPQAVLGPWDEHLKPAPFPLPGDSDLQGSGAT